MDKERILFRNTFKSPSLLAYYDQTTTISFIPVCDNCNYVFNSASGKIGSPHIEPFMCPKCGKIIECIRLPRVDAYGELNYEED